MMLEEIARGWGRVNYEMAKALGSARGLALGRPRRLIDGCLVRRTCSAQESWIRDRRHYEPCAGHRREHSDFFLTQRTGPARSPGASSRTTSPLRRTKRR